MRNFHPHLTNKFCLLSAPLKKSSKVIWSLLVPGKDSSLTWTIMTKKWRGRKNSQQSDPQWPSHHFQTQNCLFHVGDVSCPLLQETPARHHGPIRELLANNTRAQCHLQLLPLHKGPQWKWIVHIYSSFIRLTWKTELFMCVYYDLGLQWEP